MGIKGNSAYPRRTGGTPGTKATATTSKAGKAPNLMVWGGAALAVVLVVYVLRHKK